MTNLLTSVWTVFKFVMFCLGTLLSVALVGKNSKSVKAALNEAQPIVKF